MGVCTWIRTHAWALGHYGRLIHLRGYGHTDWAPGSDAVTDSSLFDVASLTKGIATTTAAIILEEEKRLDLDKPVHFYVPELKATITSRPRRGAVDRASRASSMHGLKGERVLSAFTSASAIVRRIAACSPSASIVSAITRNADLLSVQRAKNLTRGFDEPVRALIDDGLRWLARIATDEGKDLRWRSLLKHRSPSRSVWVAPVVRGNKGRASRARVTDPATLVLRLRLAFAVGVKADLLSYLLCTPDEWASVRTVSAMTGYTPAAVRRAADDLAGAQFVESQAAHPVRYRIAREQWRPLLRFDEDLPPWRGWRDVYSFATVFLAWHRMAADTRTPYVMGVEARELLERHRAVFERDRIATWGRTREFRIGWRSPRAVSTHWLAGCASTRRSWMHAAPLRAPAAAP